MLVDRTVDQDVAMVLAGVFDIQVYVVAEGSGMSDSRQVTLYTGDHWQRLAA